MNQRLNCKILSRVEDDNGHLILVVIPNSFRDPCLDFLFIIHNFRQQVYRVNVPPAGMLPKL